MAVNDPVTHSRGTRVTHRQEPTGTPGAAPWSKPDPFAPPADPGRPAAAPPPAAPRFHEDPAWSAPPEGSAGPARPGIFWIVAVVGIGLLAFAKVLLFFVNVDDMQDEHVAPALFGMLGIVALCVGLALAALLQRGLAVPWRIALLLGAGYFATQGSIASLFGLFAGF